MCFDKNWKDFYPFYPNEYFLNFLKKYQNFRPKNEITIWILAIYFWRKNIFDRDLDLESISVLLI